MSGTCSDAHFMPALAPVQLAQLSPLPDGTTPVPGALDPRLDVLAVEPVAAALDAAAPPDDPLHAVRIPAVSVISVAARQSGRRRGVDMHTILPHAPHNLRHT